MDTNKKLFIIFFNSFITIPLFVIHLFLKIRACLLRRGRRDRTELTLPRAQEFPLTRQERRARIDFNLPLVSTTCDNKPPSYNIAMEMDVLPPSYYDIHNLD